MNKIVVLLSALVITACADDHNPRTPEPVELPADDAGADVETSEDTTADSSADASVPNSADAQALSPDSAADARAETSEDAHTVLEPDASTPSEDAATPTEPTPVDPSEPAPVEPQPEPTEPTTPAPSEPTPPVEPPAPTTPTPVEPTPAPCTDGCPYSFTATEAQTPTFDIDWNAPWKQFRGRDETAFDLGTLPTDGVVTISSTADIPGTWDHDRGTFTSDVDWYRFKLVTGTEHYDVFATATGSRARLDLHIECPYSWLMRCHPNDTMELVNGKPNCLNLGQVPTSTEIGYGVSCENPVLYVGVETGGRSRPATEAYTIRLEIIGRAVARSSSDVSRLYD